MTVTAEITV